MPKSYRLEVQLAYLVNFAQLLQLFASHSILPPFESFFFVRNRYKFIYLFLFGLEPLAGRILGGL